MRQAFESRLLFDDICMLEYDDLYGRWLTCVCLFSTSEDKRASARCEAQDREATTGRVIGGGGRRLLIVAEHVPGLFTGGAVLGWRVSCENDALSLFHSPSWRPCIVPASTSPIFS